MWSMLHWVHTQHTPTSREINNQSIHIAVHHTYTDGTETVSDTQHEGRKQDVRIGDDGYTPAETQT